MVVTFYFFLSRLEFFLRVKLDGDLKYYTIDEVSSGTIPLNQTFLDVFSLSKLLKFDDAAANSHEKGISVSQFAKFIEQLDRLDRTFEKFLYIENVLNDLPLGN